MSTTSSTKCSLTDKEWLEFNKIVSVDKQVKDLEIEITQLLKSVEKNRTKLRGNGVYI